MEMSERDVIIEHIEGLSKRLKKTETKLSDSDSKDMEIQMREFCNKMLSIFDRNYADREKLKNARKINVEQAVELQNARGIIKREQAENAMLKRKLEKERKKRVGAEGDVHKLYRDFRKAMEVLPQPDSSESEGTAEVEQLPCSIMVAKMGHSDEQRINEWIQKTNQVSTKAAEYKKTLGLGSSKQFGMKDDKTTENKCFLK